MREEEHAAGKRARRMLVCASGAFLAYSLPGLVLHLLRHFADDVQVVLSRAAARMVSPYAVEVATRNRVFVEIDDCGDGVYVPHIELGRNVDLILVYPATISILGKVAGGITDELISALIIAAEAPVVFVPIANPAMVTHPAVRRNIEQLQGDGYLVLPPLEGPEVATREGLERMDGPFPMPTLLLQMIGVLRDPERASARRGPPDR
jgi:phosphopantothenoylcysteine synthetase/decarboxylase